MDDEPDEMIARSSFPGTTPPIHDVGLSQAPGPETWVMSAAKAGASNVMPPKVNVISTGNAYGLIGRRSSF